MSARLVMTGVSFALALISAPALAQYVPANLYECAGTNLSVTYSTTSFAGVPQITIEIDGVAISRRGDEIQSQATVLGSLVTIVRKQIPDLYTDTLTLIAPDVNLKAKGARVGFTTELFSTRTNTTIAGPQQVLGLIQQSTSKRLYCAATAVDF